MRKTKLPTSAVKLLKDPRDVKERAALEVFIARDLYGLSLGRLEAFGRHVHLRQRPDESGIGRDHPPIARALGNLSDVRRSRTMLGGTKTQFSLTRAARGTRGHAKSELLSLNVLPTGSTTLRTTSRKQRQSNKQHPRTPREYRMQTNACITKHNTLINSPIRSTIRTVCKRYHVFIWEVALSLCLVGCSTPQVRSPDGTRTVSLKGHWNKVSVVENDKVLSKHDQVLSVAFSPDSKRLAYAVREIGLLRTDKSQVIVDGHP